MVPVMRSRTVEYLDVEEKESRKPEKKGTSLLQVVKYFQATFSRLTIATIIK